MSISPNQQVSHNFNMTDCIFSSVGRRGIKRAYIEIQQTKVNPDDNDEEKISRKKRCRSSVAMFPGDLMQVLAAITGSSEDDHSVPIRRSFTENALFDSHLIRGIMEFVSPREQTQDVIYYTMDVRSTTSIRCLSVNPVTGDVWVIEGGPGLIYIYGSDAKLKLRICEHFPIYAFNLIQHFEDGTAFVTSSSPEPSYAVHAFRHNDAVTRSKRQKRYDRRLLFGVEHGCGGLAVTKDRHGLPLLAIHHGAITKVYNLKGEVQYKCTAPLIAIGNSLLTCGNDFHIMEHNIATGQTKMLISNLNHVYSSYMLPIGKYLGIIECNFDLDNYKCTLSIYKSHVLLARIHLTNSFTLAYCCFAGVNFCPITRRIYFRKGNELKYFILDQMGV